MLRAELTFVCAQAELGLLEQSGFGVRHMALGVFHSFGRGSAEFSCLSRVDSGGSRCSVYFGGLVDEGRNKISTSIISLIYHIISKQMLCGVFTSNPKEHQLHWC